MHDSFDSGVTDLLEQGTADLLPDTQRLVAAGVARGRAQRRRNRIGTAAASVAMLGVVGGGAAVVPQLFSEPESTPIQVATAPAPVAERDPAPVGDREVVDTEAEVVLRALVPDADLFTALDPGPDGHLVRAEYDGGTLEVKAAATHSAVDREKYQELQEAGLNPPPLGSPKQECQRMASAGATCAQVDGGWLVTQARTESDPDAGELVSNYAMLLTPDGFRVEVAGASGRLAADGSSVIPTADGLPPLTLDEVAGLVQSHLWFERRD